MYKKIENGNSNQMENTMPDIKDQSMPSYLQPQPIQQSQQMPMNQQTTSVQPFVQQMMQPSCGAGCMQQQQQMQQMPAISQQPTMQAIPVQIQSPTPMQLAQFNDHDQLSMLNYTMPITADSLQYLNGFLRTQIGRRVKVEFLIGTNSFVDKDGTLLGVGINYIIINETDTDDLTACDFYNIKFIKFYY